MTDRRGEPDANICPTCDGTGLCPRCNGEGRHAAPNADEWVEYATCGGSGRCVECDGSGRREQD